MTHPEIALETTAEERNAIRGWLDQDYSVDEDPSCFEFVKHWLGNTLNDIDTLLARVADAERAGRIKGLEEAAVLVANRAIRKRGIFGDVSVSLYDAARDIRALIPDPETKEDDNG